MEYLELDMNLSDEQMDLKKSVHKFAKEVLRPGGPYRRRVQRRAGPGGGRGHS